MGIKKYYNLDLPRYLGEKRLGEKYSKRRTNVKIRLINFCHMIVKKMKKFHVNASGQIEMHHTFKLEEVIHQNHLQANPGTRLPLYRNAGLKRAGSDDIIHENTKLNKKSRVEVEVDKEERREKVEDSAVSSIEP